MDWILEQVTWGIYGVKVESIEEVTDIYLVEQHFWGKVWLVPIDKVMYLKYDNLLVKIKPAKVKKTESTMNGHCANFPKSESLHLLKRSTRH